MLLLSLGSLQHWLGLLLLMLGLLLGLRQLLLVLLLRLLLGLLGSRLSLALARRGRRRRHLLLLLLLLALLQLLVEGVLRRLSLFWGFSPRWRREERCVIGGVDRKRFL